MEPKPDKAINNLYIQQRNVKIVGESEAERSKEMLQPGGAPSGAAASVLMSRWKSKRCL